MALAEARAAWQRSANRCLVQEDAKRAPKLACCSSVPSTVKHTETEPINTLGGQDIPSSNTSPFHQTPSYSNLSASTTWWLQTRPNYRCQRDSEGNTVEKSSGDVARSEDDYELVCQTSHMKPPFENHCKNLVACEKKGVKVKEKLTSIYDQNCQDPPRIECEEDMEALRDIVMVSSEGSKNSSDLYTDFESSLVGTVKNIPWWRTADTEELACLVAQKSLDLIDNCDLPSPKNAHVKKNQGYNKSLLSRKSGIADNHHSGTRSSSLATSEGSCCQNLRMVPDIHFLSPARVPLRNGCEIHMREDDLGKARLLEALRHSQTRARLAETVAKQACAEKEHVIKLVFRQAQQIFAYKQLVHLLQLENMCFQLKNNKTVSASPDASPWSRTSARNRKVRKGWMKSCSSRNRSRGSGGRCDVGKYAIFLALGLGLVGAGLLLGWNIGLMLPAF